MRRVYLDNNATTPLAPEVLEAMRPYLTEQYGNASSIHWFGQQAKSAVENAREQMAKLIHARPNDVVFTSGGTESDNACVFGIVEAAPPQGQYDGKHVIISSIEHHAVLNAAQALEKRGTRVTYVRVGTDGIVDPADVEAAIRPETVLAKLAQRAHDIVAREQFQKVATEHGVEGLIAKGHVARVHRLAVRLGVGEPAPRGALRACRHVRRKIHSDGGAAPIGAYQAPEHLTRTGSDFEHLHPVPDSGSLQRTAVRPRMEKHGGNGIDRRHAVVHASGSIGQCSG